MFIPALAHESLNGKNEESARSPYCWCTATLTETGPDDQPVGLQVCTRKRSCFEE